MVTSVSTLVLGWWVVVLALWLCHYIASDYGACGSLLTLHVCWDALKIRPRLDFLLQVFRVGAGCLQVCYFPWSRLLSAFSLELTSLPFMEQCHLYWVLPAGVPVCLPRLQSPLVWTCCGVHLHLWAVFLSFVWCCDVMCWTCPWVVAGLSW